MITAAQAVVDCLRREGIDHVFGIPGTMNLPILDVLRSTPEIRFVLTRHEQGAAFMAYGFARAVNRPAIVTATEGPGVTNLTTGTGAASKGILLEHVEPEPIASSAYRPTSLPSCSAAELDRAAELIAQAKRPILLAGGGVLRENALPSLQKLADATGIPVATLQYHPDAF